MNEAKLPFDRLDYTYKLLVIIALCIAGIILAQDIVIPMAFAAFFSVVMLPLIKWMERKKVNTVFAILILLLCFSAILLLLGWLIIDQIIALVNDLPDLQVRTENFANRIRTTLNDDFNIILPEQNTLIKEGVKAVSGYVTDILVSTSNLISLIVQIPIYIFLFLIYRTKFKTFFQNIIGHDHDPVWRKDMENVLQGYVMGLSLVTVIVATLNTIGLLLLGIEHAIFFGLLSGILTVVPYVGIFIGAAFPTIIALITKDSSWYAVGVVSIFSTVQFMEGNFITPRITGSKVSINALAAIIALVIGGKILGIAGMILAVPTIGILKIILSHTTHLKPFVVLLEDGGDETPKATSAPVEESPTSNEETSSVP